MTAPPAVKGFCPTLFSPMEAGDGLLVRVKPRASRLSADDARIIADAARRFGNGHIDLTSRANLQLRGLSPDGAERLAAGLIEAGLASANPAIEAIRNVMASPLGPDDPTADFDGHSVAHDIEAMLTEESALQALPPKFCFLVDGRGTLPLAGITADIMVRPADSELISVALDGGRHAALCQGHSVAATVRSLALAFLRLATGREAPRRRMRALVMEVGEEAILADAGLIPSPAPLVPIERHQPPVGYIAHGGDAKGTFGVGLPFGRIEAEALSQLAELSAHFGEGSLRTTPWRALLLPGVARADATELQTVATALGLIADPSDARLSIFACVGAPACASAHADVRADAAKLAASLAPSGCGVIHISGCAKSCAWHGRASLTLVAHDRNRYDLIRNGSVADRPSLTGLGIDDVIALIEIAEGNAA